MVAADNMGLAEVDMKEISVGFTTRSVPFPEIASLPAHT